MAAKLSDTQQIVVGQIDGLVQAMRGLTGEVGELRGGVVAMVTRVEKIEGKMDTIHTTLAGTPEHRKRCMSRFDSLEAGIKTAKMDPLEDAKAKLLKVAGFAALATGSVGILGAVAYNVVRAIMGDPPAGAGVLP